MKGWKIFILAVVVYGVSVFGGFIQDDVKVIVGDPEMGEMSAVISAFVRPYYYMDGGTAGAYRPVTSASFYLNALITGKGAWGFRLVNIFLYAGFCLLVFEVLKKFTSAKKAFWATMIFTVLPIHAEAVNNIVGRGEILSLGFVLLAILMQDRKRWELSAGMFLLALLSKETAIVGLPALLYLLIIGKEDKNTKIGVGSFYVLVTISYFVLRMMVLGAGGMGNNATMVENPLKFVSVSQRVMNAFALVPFGVSKVIFPMNLSYDYSFNQIKLISNWFDPRVLLGVLMMLLSLGSLFTKLGKNKMWILGQAFFWGSLVVTGNFLFSVGTIFGERLWFWPSLGMVMMAICLYKIFLIDYSFHSHSLLAQRKMSSKEIFGKFSKLDKYFGLLLILVLLSRTVVRNIDWLSQERLFIHDVNYAKGSVMAQSNAAAMYLIKKDLVKGKEYLEKGEAIYPKYPELMNNKGMYYLWSGDREKARDKFEECLREKPGFYLCESNIKLLK